jgi:hypothetical protein
MRRAWLVLLATACGEVTTNGNDNPPPIIQSVSPDRGGVPGGHTITVSGSGFTDNAAGDNYVVVGDIAATDVVAEDDATLTFTLPPGAEPDAIVDLTIFNNNGFAVLPDALQYSPYPTVLSLSQGFTRSAGDGIQIFGTGFEALDAGTNRVTIGGVEAASVEVVSDTEMAIEVAPRPDDIDAFQPLDVVIENGNGTTTLAGAFKYTKQGMLRIDWNRGNPGLTTIYFVDLDADEVTETPVITAPVSVHAAVLANNGSIYVIASGPRRSSLQTLARLDPLTGAVQFLGSIEGSPQDTMRDITFSDGVLYGMMKNFRQLAAIDLEDGSYTAIGAQDAYPDGGDVYGFPFALARRNDTSLWAASNLTATLYRVNTADSAATVQVVLAGETGAAVNAFLLFDGDLYAATKSSAVIGQNGLSLVKVDTTTGAITLVHQFNGVHSTLVPTPPLF